MATKKQDFKIEFDIGTIKHLGLQMYSTLPPVIGELVANAWDADAEHVDITIPKTTFTDDSVIVIEDDGEGNSPFYERTRILRAQLARRVIGFFPGVKRIAMQEPAPVTLGRAVICWRPVVLAIVGGIRTAPSGTTGSLLPEYSAGSTLADFVAAMRRCC